MFTSTFSADALTEATAVEWEQWAVSESESDNNDDYTPYTALYRDTVKHYCKKNKVTVRTYAHYIAHFAV